MPRRRLHALLLFPVCLLPLAIALRPAAAFGVHHPPKKEAREQVLDLEQQWRTATLGGDAAVMDKLLSDDYVGISWTGQVNTKAMQLERLRSRSLLITRMDLSDIKVRVVGSVAIVTSKAEIEGTSDGNEMKGTFLYTRIYTRVPAGTWKITNFESTRVPTGPRRNHGGPPQGPPPPPPA